MATAPDRRNYVTLVGPSGFRDLVTQNGFYYDPGTFALYVNDVPLLGSGHIEQGRLSGVSTTGITVVFGTAFESVEKILEVSVVGRSSDGLTVVTVGITLTASQVTFYPSEDDTTISYKFEEIAMPIVNVPPGGGVIHETVTITEAAYATLDYG